MNIFEIDEVYIRNNIEYKYGFEVIVSSATSGQWNFSSYITDVISWLVINIGERDIERWNIEIKLRMEMNPMEAKFSRLLILFVDEVDAAAFKLRWL